MKIYIGIIIFFLAFSIHAQETSPPDWFHLEGVSNPDYKVYLDMSNIDYLPGVSIIVNLKYEYINSETIQTSIHKVKFDVTKDTYDELSKIHIYKSDTSHISELTNPRHLIPGSEMSVIYQGVYIQAVSNYRPKSK
jgi:hypothetical protein